MIRKPVAVWRGTALAILLWCMCSPAYAAGGSDLPDSAGPKLVTGQEGEKTIVMEFYGTQIDHVLRLLSRAAGVNIVKSDQVTGPLTVISPAPVSIEEAFQILNEVLAVRGFTMVRSSSGGYKVVPREDAMQLPLPLRFGARPEEVPASEDLVTQVIPLTNLDAGDMMSRMEGLLSDTARVVPTATNSLIVTDSAGNIRQVLRIIAEIEEELASGLRVFQIYYHDAEDLAQLVDTLILSRGGVAGRVARRPWEQQVRRAAGPVRTPARAAPAQVAAAARGPEFCYPDTRTNSLVVLATPLHQKQIEELISELDRPVSLRDSYSVYPVQNLMASELAALVGPLVGAEVKAEAPGAPARGGTQRPRAGARLPGGLGTAWPGSAGRGTRLQARGARGLPGEARGAPRLGRLEVEPLAGAGEGGSALQRRMAAQPPETAAGMTQGPVEPAAEVGPQPELPAGEPVTPPEEEAAQVALGPKALIVSDDNTNTLLISAPAEQLDLIEQMLEELDVLPPQVHIRAIIAEVLLTRDTSLGIQWNWLQTLGPYGGAEAVGDFTTNFGLSPSDDEGAASPIGLFGQISSDEFEGILHALTTDSHVRILSTPSVFTSNNEEAAINVSQRIPFPSGTIEYATGEGALSTYVNYEDVGVVVTVRPRVTQGDTVRMEITVSADELGTSISVAGQEYPSTNKRTATATLNVKDGYTIVLGGLMRDSIRRSATKVPILGDLPLVGSLFRSTSSKREKSELVLFLTPRVVRTPTEAARLTDEEKSRLPEVPRSLRPPADAAAAP